MNKYTVTGWKISECRKYEEVTLQIRARNIEEAWKKAYSLLKINIIMVQGAGR